MRPHTYLRAYMAGTIVPTIFLLFIMTGYCILRYVYNFPVAVERIIVFPMAVVPNLWGLWNMLFVVLRSRSPLPIGIHGAILPILLGPLGFMLTRILDFPVRDFVWREFLVGAVIALIVYYLAWKYVVAFLNRVVEVA
jgi:hypothetical protein